MAEEEALQLTGTRKICLMYEVNLNSYRFAKTEECGANEVLVGTYTKEGVLASREEAPRSRRIIARSNEGVEEAEEIQRANRMEAIKEKIRSMATR